MKRLIAAALLAVSGVSATAHGQTIDIEQTYSNWIASNGLSRLAQTFTAVSSTNAGAGFSFSNSPQGGALSGTATISLLTGAPGAGTLLASGVANWSVGADPYSGTIVNAFWAPVGLTVGETYWLHVVTGSPSAWLQASDANSYGGGAMQVYFEDVWQVFGDGAWDAEFRTFTTTVPEPSTYAFVAVGLLAIGVTARRRRAP